MARYLVGMSNEEKPGHDSEESAVREAMKHVRGGRDVFADVGKVINRCYHPVDVEILVEDE